MTGFILTLYKAYKSSCYFTSPIKQHS